MMCRFICTPSPVTITSLGRSTPILIACAAIWASKMQKSSHRLSNAILGAIWPGPGHPPRPETLIFNTGLRFFRYAKLLM